MQLLINGGYSVKLLKLRILILDSFLEKRQRCEIKKASANINFYSHNIYKNIFFVFLQIGSYLVKYHPSTCLL